MKETLRANGLQQPYALGAHLAGQCVGDPPDERADVFVNSSREDNMPHSIIVREVRTLMADVVRWSIDAYYHIS